MSITTNELQVKRLFESIKRFKSGQIPEPTALSTRLERLVLANQDNATFLVDQSIIQLFATASIEMWHRSLHSYLMSLSLTNASPIWSSVAGYYSSHYAVRSIAHILGVFQLFNAKKIIKLDLNASGNVCNVRPKGGEGREHDVYWKIVKAYNPFDNDPLFTDNKARNSQLSDAKHRERANYADHVNKVPNFIALDLETLQERANHIANLSLDVPPIPNYKDYPEVENVQIVAYHRLMRVRTYIDDILGTSINYWNVHRDPAWARAVINYEPVESNLNAYIKQSSFSL